MNQSKGKNSNDSFQLPWRTILDEYKLHLETAGRSPKYIEWTLSNLCAFFNFLESKRALKAIDKLGTKELRSYVQFLQNRKRWPNRPGNGKNLGKLSPSAIAGHVRSVKVFWSWLTSEDYVKKNLIARFPQYKIPQYVIPVLSDDQMSKLLSAIDKATPVGAKYYCIFLLFLDNGMRVAELVKIEMENLDIAQGMVKIFGKGQKERIVPFYRNTRKELLRYINRYRPLICSEDSPYLFPSKDSHISVGSVQQYMRRLAKKAGLNNIRCYPHKIRHTAATKLIAKGASDYVVKDILGHRSLQTTLKYTHLQLGDIKSQHNKFSPVEDLLKGKS